MEPEDEEEGVSEGVTTVGRKSQRPPHKRDLEQSSIKGKGPCTKKRRFTNHRNSTTKLRLGGSLSDPLNLEVWSDDNECSTCAPSPADGDRHLGDQSRVPLPEELHHDPLNLEEKITDFETLVESFNQIRPVHASMPNKDKRKRRRRTRQKSQSESSSNSMGEANPLSSNHASAASPSSSSLSLEKPINSKAAVYRYGNYDRYYTYRNKGSLTEDPRLKLFSKEWFEGKKCLDIGSNTGQVTIEIGQKFAPNSITGIDIDGKLVRTASKNLHRFCLPSKMPDGRPVPQSILMSFCPVNWLKSTTSNSSKTSTSSRREFPNNVQFKQGNYVPLTDEELMRTQPEYDVILCLSVTKWIHLNWGDEALKRTFKKMYRNLLPGGRLILEPQPWVSYGRRRKLTPEIFKNYQNIKFLPDRFHTYLLSSEVGFSILQYAGPSDNTNKGFQRLIHVYVKGDYMDDDGPSLPDRAQHSSLQAPQERPHNSSSSNDKTLPDPSITVSDPLSCNLDYEKSQEP